MKQQFFITGTDTHVGKTWITAGLTTLTIKKKFTAVGVKPIASDSYFDNEGKLVNDDVLTLQNSSNPKPSYETINCYTYQSAIAPHIAAANHNEIISTKEVIQLIDNLTNDYEIMFIEGVGGWSVPINDQEKLSDLVVKLKLPVILVVGLKLGCLNHALLTAAKIQQDGCQLMGWIANQVDQNMLVIEENMKTLEKLITAPCLGKVPFQAEFNPNKIASYLDLPLS